VRDRLLVLLLRERVDRPELLPPPPKPLDASGQGLAIRLRKRAVPVRLGLLESQSLREAGELDLGLG
jgi:hypothetical protein